MQSETAPGADPPADPETAPGADPPAAPENENNESLEDQIVRITRERDDERLLTKDLNQEILNLKLAMRNLKQEKEDCEAGMEEICSAKLGMSQAVAEAKFEAEGLRKKIISLQMEALEQHEFSETLEQQLAQAHRSERERYEEVKMQAQRLQQAEQDLEEMERSMSQIRAPPPTTSTPLKSSSPQLSDTPQNKSFGLKEAGGWLKNLVNGKINTAQPLPKYPKAVEEILQKFPENTKCADCQQPNPIWLSTGFGAFVCTECAGVHRSFGTHITNVKSLTLDTIRKVQLSRACGNKEVNSVYLSKLTTAIDFTDSSKRTERLRDKYLHKKYKKDEILICADCRTIATENSDVPISMNLVLDHGTLVCSSCCLIHERANKTGEIIEIKEFKKLQKQIILSEAANARLTHSVPEDYVVDEPFLKDKYLNRKFSTTCADCCEVDAMFFIPRYAVLVCDGCSHIHKSFDVNADIINVTKSTTPILIDNDASNTFLAHDKSIAIPPKSDPSFRDYLINKYRESRPLPTHIVCADCNTASSVPAGVKSIGYNHAHGTFLCSKCCSIQQEILGIDAVADVDLSLYDSEKNKLRNSQLLGGLPKGMKLPNPDDDDALRKFIADKYKHKYVNNPDVIPGSSWLSSTLTRFQNMAHTLFSDSESDKEVEDEEPVLVDCDPTSDDGIKIFIPKIYGFIKERKTKDDNEPESPITPPTLSLLPDTSVILSAAWRQLLCQKLPSAYGNMDWIRTYCSSIDGGSLPSLYAACAEKGANILLVKTTEGEVFGGYSNEVCVILRRLWLVMKNKTK